MSPQWTPQFSQFSRQSLGLLTRPTYCSSMGSMGYNHKLEYDKTLLALAPELPRFRPPRCVDHHPRVSRSKYTHPTKFSPPTLQPESTGSELPPKEPPRPLAEIAASTPFYRTTRGVIVIIAVVIICVAAIVGGAVGGVLGSRHVQASVPPVVSTVQVTVTRYVSATTSTLSSVATSVPFSFLL
jgi:hypothetical protein